MRSLRAPASFVTVAILLSACASGSEPQADPKEPKPVAVSDPEPSTGAAGGLSDAPVTEFKLWRAMKTLRKLSGGRGIGIRERATSGERTAARFLAKRFRQFGYEVEIQKFSVDGGRSRNVIARWSGQVDHPFVIGAHMDSVPGSPGANDNASGTAAILEAARLVAGKKPSRLITWVAFGSEEYGDDGRHHVGSEIYVRRSSTKERERMPGMLSVDMVSDGKPLLTGSFGIGPRVLGKMVYRRITRNTTIAMRYQTLCDCSDNGPFEHAGIPGAFMYSGPEPDYHSPGDIPPNMRPKHLKRTGRALMAFVRRLDARTLRYLRRF